MKKFLSLLFIPQVKNNHRALILQPPFLTALIGLYLANQYFLHLLPSVKPGILGYSSEITVQKVVELTNQERRKLNLPSLSYNSTLSRSATLKAENMFEEKYWAHNSPSGKTPWDFFRLVNYDYSTAGENLARDFYDNESMLSAWMNSPTHKANIVSEKYKEIGIGVVDGVLNGVKTTIVVQHFGAPINGVVANDPLPGLSADSSSPSTLGNHDTRLVSPLTVNKAISLVLFSVIMLVLFVDSFITLRNRTKRMTGSSAGHIGFLLIIIVFMLLSRSGSIF